MRRKLKLSEDKISKHLKNANDYIGKKIAEHNRGSRAKKRKKDGKKKSKSAKKFKSVQNIEDKFSSDEKHEILQPGQSADSKNHEENQNVEIQRKEREEKEDDENGKERELVIDEDSNSSRETRKLDSADNYDHVRNYKIYNVNYIFNYMFNL